MPGLCRAAGQVPAAASAVTPSTAAPASRLVRLADVIRLADAGALDADEAGGFRPAGKLAAVFRLAVMTWPSLIYWLRCHNHSR